MLGEEQRSIIMQLTTGTLGRSEFERLFLCEPANEPARTVALLERAHVDRNADDVDYALLLAHTVGLTAAHVPILNQLLLEPWHQKHEDIASVLQRLQDPRGVESLYTAAQATHAYLDYDEVFGLARKCTWALAKIGTPEALESLRRLAKGASSEIVRGYAAKRL
jgi:HEAT repeat protein